MLKIISRQIYFLCTATSLSNSCKRPPLEPTDRPGSGEKEESPPKLDPDGQSIQDKKKSDTLRKLFSKREGEAGLGKGKGGKGGGKGGGKVAPPASDGEPSNTIIPPLEITMVHETTLRYPAISLICSIELSRVDPVITQQVRKLINSHNLCTHQSKRIISFL